MRATFLPRAPIPLILSRDAEHRESKDALRPDQPSHGRPNLVKAAIASATLW